MAAVRELRVTLPALHSKQREIADHPARFKVVAAGRRFGKSRLGSALCVKTGLQGGRAWWVAPTYPIASVGWRMIKRLAQPIPLVEIREADRIITFPGGGSVQVRSADNPDSLRGEGLDRLVLDECAFVKEAAWTEALRPTLADRLGDALFISTPKGRNWFWTIWQRGMDPAEPDWQSWQLPTTASPFIEPSEVEAARHGLPELVFQQEFMAEFLSDGGEIFRRVTEAATATRQDAPSAGHEYVIGVDWGKLNDFTVLAVIDTTIKELAYLDRFNMIDYSVQMGRLQALVDRFRPYNILAERNSIGEPLIDQLAVRGLPVEPFLTTNQTKAAAIDGLALAFEQGAIKILPDPILIAELQAFTAERLPSGLLRYGAPDGMHDDCVMALALAWQAASQSGWLVWDR